MLTIWQAPITRPTKDIDFLGRMDNDIKAVVLAIKEICIQEVEPDGIIFDHDSVLGQRITEDADYAGVHVRFRGNLSTARISMQLDIGFGDEVFPPTEKVEYPTILPGFPPPVLRCYSKESQVAEKFEAMVKWAN